MELSLGGLRGYVALLVMGMACASAQAQSSNTLTEIDLQRDPPDALTAGPPTEPFFPWGAWAERVKTAEIAPLAVDAFGEQVSLFDGRTSFSVTDVDIPGSDALPVRLSRTLAITARQRSGGLIEDLGGIGDWSLDIPYIAGVFDSVYPWTIDSRNPAFDGKRCSEDFLPKARGPLAMAWSGNRVHIPGKGDRTLLLRDPAVPTPDAAGAYAYVTAELDTFSCTNTIKNPGSDIPREGFVMHSPDGTKWIFDVEARREAGMVELPTSAGGTAHYGRKEVYLLVSKVEDRFGNRVEYLYTYPPGPEYRPRLEEIRAISVSNEQRSILLQYEPVGADGWRLEWATAHGRTWHYQYFPNDADEDHRGRLKSVTLPDDSAWEYELVGSLNVFYDPDGTACKPPAPPGGNFSYLVTHPAGARAMFEFANQRFFRSVEASLCGGSDRKPPTQYDAFTLTRKEVLGAGLQSPLVWSYVAEHGAIAGSARRSTTVTQPDGSSVVHEFGNTYDVDEGRLYKTTTYAGAASSSAQLREETLAYARTIDGGTAAYPAQWGIARGTADQTLARVEPVKSRSIVQDGVTFARVSAKADFDNLARVTHETLSGSAGTKTRDTSYWPDNHSLWVLGQVATVSETETQTGITRVLVSNTYEPQRAMLAEVREFGRLVRSQTWTSDGTLATQSDGKGNTTRFFNYWRGIPQTIKFADQTTQMSAVVDDWGQITSMTDPEGYTTGYEYYPQGRLKKITYPSAAGDPVWNTTSFTYTPFAGAGDFACPGTFSNCKHWQSTRTTGGVTVTTSFDGLWRPRLARTQVTGVGASTSYVRRDFDHEGRETFASYPSASAGAATGIWTTYDALGRVIATAQDSELGQIGTTSVYDAPHKRTTTDARDNMTETKFVSFSEPAYDTPTEIRRKLLDKSDQVTALARDSFGKIKTMARSGAGHAYSASRSFTYNDQQQLCSVTEPESGTTAFGYDLADNLAWRGRGSADTCVQRGAATEVVDYQYDALNRLRTTTFPTGTAPITQDWYADGALRSISQGPVSWIYGYNARRLLTTEKLQLDSKTFQLDWTYSANGHISGLAYPDGTLVDFAPDALGRPSQAGSFADGVTYWPNGAVHTFTYGNGRTHEMTPNARQLPRYSTDPGVVDLEYKYDGNGNVTDIIDHAQGGLDTRTMTYDALDRLETAASDPQRWGLASFEYDGVDNLRKATIGGAVTNYTINPVTNRLDALTGAEPIVYGYDPRGNVTQRAARFFTFDAADRIVSTTTGSTPDESYLYDGHGRRVRITRTSNQKTYQVYSKAGQLLAEEAPDGTATNYVYLNGSLVARTGTGGSTPAPFPGITPNPSFTGLYTVSWPAVAGASEYRLLQSSNGGPDATVYSGTGLAWSPPSAKPTGAYGYRVVVCAPTCGAPGAQAWVTVLRPPAAPNATPNPSTTGSFTVSWNASAVASGYRLDERQGSGAWNEGVYYGTATSQAFTGKPNGQWSYRLALCASPTSCSAPGAARVVTVDRPTPPPPAPAWISVNPTSSSNGQFTVTWPASTGATSYRLRERFGGNFTDIPLDATQNQQRTWSPSPPKDLSGEYAYSVAACNAPGNCSTYTVGAVVVVTLPVGLATPTGLQVCRTGNGPKPCAAAGSTLYLAGSNNYRVSWNAVENATSYQFQRTRSTAQFPNPQTSAPQTIYTEYVNGGGNPAADGGWFDDSYRVRACAGANCSGWTYPEARVRVENNPARLTATSTAYYHTDALGSPVAETDASGAIVKRTAYRPWGVPVTGNYEQGPGYTGHVTDEKTGLSYMQQRYYDPVAGRFLSVDPVSANPVSFNRYWYANNNPYKFTDPDGRSAVCTDSSCSIDCSSAISCGADYLYVGIKIAQKHLENVLNNEGQRSKPRSDAGTSESDEGCIYCVPGEHTSSGKDYVGSTDDLGKRAQDKSDGRDRTKAEKVDSYKKGDRAGRQNKEQQAMNDRGGKEKLDNKRNEVSEKKWGERDIRPPGGGR